ncbi:hypothetical protein KZP23_08010 [Echinicola marina]|uniref:hypothetical protein n=1 Tax=Echinicola marina TaxID=2859768 RepID=UPI001CF6DA70|nr:hypothetical protein [Echinicola marina]UCS94946.1 hypothetical protein KZP23_08010 [Echinicola marina]
MNDLFKVVLGICLLNLFCLSLLAYHVQEIETLMFILSSSLSLTIAAVFFSKMRLEFLFKVLLTYFCFTCLILLANHFMYTWISLDIVWLAGNILILALLLYIRAVLRKSAKTKA